MSQIMENISDHVHAFERSITELGDIFENFTDDYLACAVYLTTHDNRAVFALSHAGRKDDYNHYHRTDKHVYRRRLSVENSVAAEKLLTNRFTLASSRMFSSHQDCAHVALLNDQNPSDRVMLQVALKKGTSLRDDDIARILQKGGFLLKLTQQAKPFIQGSPEKRDQLFGVRAPYNPNAIVALFDISNFSKLGENIGPYRAQDLADRFIKDLMKEAADAFEPSLLRLEGDGVWLKFPVTNNDPAPAYERAQKMSAYLMERFQAFVHKNDQRAEQITLKAVMELGEIRELFWNKAHKNEKPDDRSGPVFTAIEKASKTKATRMRNELILGPELRARLNGEETYNIVPDNFQIAQ